MHVFPVLILVDSNKVLYGAGSNQLVQVDVLKARCEEPAVEIAALQRNMQGVSENDTVNLEGLLSHGAICHSRTLYCLLVLLAYPPLYFMFWPLHLLVCLCVGVKMLNY